MKTRTKLGILSAIAAAVYVVAKSAKSETKETATTSTPTQTSPGEPMLEIGYQIGTPLRNPTKNELAVDQLLTKSI